MGAAATRVLLDRYAGSDQIKGLTPSFRHCFEAVLPFAVKGLAETLLCLKSFQVGGKSISSETRR